MKTFLRGIAFVAVVTLAFGVGFALKDISNGEFPSGAAFASLLKGGGNAEKTPTQIFRQHFDLIQSKYYRQVKPERLKFAAMEGLFGALGDPHTNFLEPKIAETFALETRGDFVGVGARLSDDALGARVMVVFRNSPADRAGLKVGDIIVQVDGKKVGGMAVEEIVDVIRGEEGTTVRISVVRSQSARPVELRITREVVIVPTAEGKMLPNNIGYLAVSGFAEPTPDQFDQALNELALQKPHGLIIDLRGNPGGLLESAAEMLSRFVEGKTVVTMRGRGGKEDSVQTPRGKLNTIPYPLVILMNDESASAAEIFAGVLRDYKKATLVGEHSYGKASVQNVFMLMDMASAKVTIAKYYLPSGLDISRKVDEDGTYISGGLKPDVEVPLELDGTTMLGEPGRDNQLQRAMDLIIEKRGGQTQASAAAPIRAYGTA